MSWSFVQKASNGTGTGTVSSCAVSLSGVAVGDLLFVTFSSYDPSSYTYSISDGHNTYTPGPTRNSGGGFAIYSASFWTVVTTGGSLTITVSSTTATGFNVGVLEFATAPGAAISLVTNNSNNSATGNPSSGALTFGSAAGNLLGIGYAADQSPATTTVAGQICGISATQGNCIYWFTSGAYTNIDEYLLNLTSAASPGVAGFTGETTLWCCNGIIFSETLAVALTLTGPSTGAVNAASTNFTVTPASAVTDTVAFDDGGKGGSFSPSSLTFTASAVAQTFTYTPVTTGAITLTLTRGGGALTSGSPATYTVSGAYTLTGPTSGTVNAASTNFTVTPSGTIANDAMTLSDGAAGGTFTPSTLSWSNSSAAKTFTYTPAAIGAITLTLTSGDGYTVTNSPKAYTSNAVGLTLTGPTSGAVGTASTNFTVTPAATTTDTITFGDGGKGGTFAPTSLIFTGSAVAQTFTYKPATTGAIALTLTSADGATITNSPKTYTVSAAYTVTGPSSGVSGTPSANFTVTPFSVSTS